MRSSIGYLFMALLILSVSGLQSTLADDSKDWPGWRGTSMDAVVSGTGTFEAGKNYALKVAWKKKLGSGYSSISVVGDRAVTMTSDSTFDYVVALDSDSGNELWRFKIDSTYIGHDGSHDGPISTPLIDGQRVYALAPKGQFFALDLGNGSELWRTHLVDDYEAIVPHYGFSTSPVVDGAQVILETGSPGKTISGFSKSTGELLWSTGTDTVNYQSPMIAEIDGQEQLLCIGDKYLYGLEPASGEKLWEYHHKGGWISINPVILDNNKIFLQHKHRESMLLQVRKEDDGYAAEEVWTSRNIRGTYDTPNYYDGHLYGYSARFLTCVEADSGKSVWKSRKPGDGFTILVDGHLVILTKKGSLHIAKASPEGYQEVAGTDLFDGIAWTPVSFANGRIYARSLTEIAVVDIVSTDQMMTVEDEGIIEGSKFAQFIERVESAATGSRTALIDKFIKEQKAFPVIEGDDMVHFVFRGEANDVAFVGDLIGFRHEQPMHRVAGTDFFYYSMNVAEPDLRFNYGFTIDFERNVIDSLNTRSHVGIFGPASWASMPKWEAPAHLAELSDGAVRGRVDTLQHESKVNESTRRLDIYLPAGYDESDRRYQVAYVHWGNLAQNMGQWVTSLDNLLGKSVEPIIVVFIPGLPNDRGAEYSGGKKDAYSQMIVEEIVPMIDEKYRTIARPDARANIAFGFSGYTAWYTTFKNPGTFGKVATQSFFTLDDGLSELQPVVKPASEVPLKIYYSWTKYDFRSELELWGVDPISQRFTAFLKEKGHSFEPEIANDGFGWASWRNRTDRLLGTLYPIQN